MKKKTIKLSNLSKETQAAVRKELSANSRLTPEYIERTIGYASSRTRGGYTTPAHFNWSSIGSLLPEDAVIWATALLDKAKEAVEENKNLTGEVDWEI